MTLAGWIRRRWRSLRAALASRNERNALLLYAEVAAAGVMMAAQSFYSAYLLRLGASNTLVGLLSSLPPLVAVFCYLPSARILEGQERYDRWIVWALGIARAGMIPLLLLPFFLSEGLPEITLGLIVAMTLPAVLFSTGWSAFLTDLIPAEARATVLSWRMILLSAVTAVATFGFGQWLDSRAFPINYQGMFATGVVGAAASLFFVARLRLPDHALSAPRTSNKSLRGMVQSSLVASPGFRRIVVDTLLFNLGAWMIGPLFMILYVRELGASDGWVGMAATAANIGVMAGYWVAQRLVKRWGPAKTLYVTLPLVSIHAFLVALFPNLTAILLFGLMVNFASGGVNLTHSMMFLELLPKESRYGATAIYSMVMNVGAFLCPMFGVFLADQIGILPTLVVGGVLRMLGAATFYFWPLTDSGRARGRIVRQRHSAAVKDVDAREDNEND